MKIAENLDKSYTRLIRREVSGSSIGIYGDSKGSQINHSVYFDLFYGVAGLPGISSPSMALYSKNTFCILFNVDPVNSVNKNDGLFFLTRCCDRRYWEYGDKWSISLSVGDSRTDSGGLPVLYCLSSNETDSIEQLEKEIISLYDSLHYHLEHKNFRLGYAIDVDKFSIVDRQSFIRDKSLDKLGI